MSATADRNKETGRFAARRARDVVDLYPSVREVALIAATQDPILIDPSRITQRRWNETKRSDPEFEHLPNANEICRQLGGLNGPLPWHEVLEVAFDERSTEAIHVGRASVPDDYTINDERVFFTMNRVARELGQDWLTNADFLYGYARLIERDSRRKHGGHLTGQLLTYSQIRNYVEQDWSRACRIAELRPTSAVELPVHRGLPCVDALVYVFNETGRFASEKRLRQFAIDFDFALESRPRDRGWHDIVEEARQRILDETGEDPGPYDGSSQTEWTRPETRDSDLPERRRYGIARPEVLLHVIRFVEERGHGKRPTDPEWRVFQKRTGAPGKRTLNNHGGLKKLIREASKPGARERAERELHELLHPTPEQKEARAKAETERRAQSERAQQLLHAIGELGGGTVAELAAHFGWAKDTVQVWLRPLRKTGRVKSVRVESGDKRGAIDRYVLADAPSSAPLEHDPEAVAAATKPAGRRAYAALVKLGAADSNAVAAELGIQAVPAAKLLTGLVKTGFVTIEVQGHPTGRGRHITYRPSGKPLPELSETFSPIRRAVYDAVASLQPAEVAAVAKAVGKNSGSVKWQLSGLVDAGYLTKEPSGRKVGGAEVMQYRTTDKPAPAS